MGIRFRIGRRVDACQRRQRRLRIAAERIESIRSLLRLRGACGLYPCQQLLVLLGLRRHLLGAQSGRSHQGGVLIHRRSFEVFAFDRPDQPRCEDHLAAQFLKQAARLAVLQVDQRIDATQRRFTRRGIAAQRRMHRLPMLPRSTGRSASSPVVSPAKPISLASARVTRTSRRRSRPTGRSASAFSRTMAQSASTTYWSGPFLVRRDFPSPAVRPCAGFLRTGWCCADLRPTDFHRPRGSATAQDRSS